MPARGVGRVGRPGRGGGLARRRGRRGPPVPASHLREHYGRDVGGFPEFRIASGDGELQTSYSGGVDWERIELNRIPSGTSGTLAAADSSAHAWATGPTAALSKFVLGVSPVVPGSASCLWSDGRAAHRVRAHRAGAAIGFGQAAGTATFASVR